MQHMTVGERHVQGLVFGTDNIAEVQLEVGVYSVTVIAEAHAQGEIVGHKPGEAGRHIPGVELALADVQDGQDGIAVSGILAGYVEHAIGTANTNGAAPLGQEGRIVRVLGIGETAERLVNRILAKCRHGYQRKYKNE